MEKNEPHSKGFRADLHCHSTCSDGSLTPSQLVYEAKKVGLCALSITDHDTIMAYETAIPVAKELGMILGSGVEFSCIHQGKSVHVLGYDYSLAHSEIEAFCNRHKERRQERNRAILAKLAGHKIQLLEEELEGEGNQGGVIGRPHIADLMLKKGYVKSFKEAFDLYLGDGKSCYESGEPISLEETIDLIHRAEGKAFLAHPHLADEGRWIKELLEMGFDGIECYYAKCSPDKERRWIKLAKERGLLLSGGSDFHGERKAHIPLGSSWVDEETFLKIFQKKLT